MRLFDDEIKALETNTGTVVLSVIYRVVHRAVCKALHSTAFKVAVEQAVENWCSSLTPSTL